MFPVYFYSLHMDAHIFGIRIDPLCPRLSPGCAFRSDQGTCVYLCDGSELKWAGHCPLPRISFAFYRLFCSLGTGFLEMNFSFLYRVAVVLVASFEISIALYKSSNTTGKQEEGRKWRRA